MLPKPSHPEIRPAVMDDAATVAVLALIAGVPRTPHAQARQGSALFSSSVRYLGSNACRRCHEDQYASWQKALHLKMTRGAQQSDVLGDFQNAHLEKYGRSVDMFSRDGRPFMTIRRKGSDPETFEVHYTLGAKRFQGYLSKLADGRIYVHRRTSTKDLFPGLHAMPPPEPSSWPPLSRRRIDAYFWQCNPGNPPPQSDLNRADASRPWAYPSGKHLRLRG